VEVKMESVRCEWGLPRERAGRVDEGGDGVGDCELR
jgi:hypothetical protein